MAARQERDFCRASSPSSDLTGSHMPKLCAVRRLRPDRQSQGKSLCRHHSPLPAGKLAGSGWRSCSAGAADFISIAVLQCRASTQSQCCSGCSQYYFNCVYIYNYIYGDRSSSVAPLWSPRHVPGLLVASELNPHPHGALSCPLIRSDGVLGSTCKSCTGGKSPFAFCINGASWITTEGCAPLCKLSFQYAP